MSKEKKVKKEVKLQLEGGKATPAPPVGTSLGPTGINLMEFCKAFNDKTKGEAGTVFPVVVRVYEDRTFEFVLKTPPVSILVKLALGLKSGSAEPNKNKVGTLTRVQIEEIAKKKMVDMNAYNLPEAVSMVSGTARSMGVLVQE